MYLPVYLVQHKIARHIESTCCWPDSFGLSRILASLSSSDMAAVVEGCRTHGAFLVLELFIIDTHGPRQSTRAECGGDGWSIRKLAI